MKASRKRGQSHVSHSSRYQAKQPLALLTDEEPTNRHGQLCEICPTKKECERQADGFCYIVKRYGDKSYKYAGNRLKALVRDGFKCRRCGLRDSRKGKLHVHHIDENNKNHDLTNLITLCNSCHRTVHCRGIDFEL